MNKAPDSDKAPPRLRAAAALLLALAAGGCQLDEHCSPFGLGDCEGEEAAAYILDLQWTLDGICRDYGIDHWAISAHGNGHQTLERECGTTAQMWNTSFDMYREPLWPGRYTITVDAVDTLDRILASHSEDVDMNQAGERSIDMHFSAGDLGQGGCQMTGGRADPDLLMWAFILAGALALLRRRRGTPRPTPAGRAGGVAAWCFDAAGRRRRAHLGSTDYAARPSGCRHQRLVRRPGGR